MVYKFLTISTLSMASALFMAAAHPAQAKEPDSYNVQKSVLENFAECAAIADNSARLSCYDRKMAESTTVMAEAQKELDAIAADSFGLSEDQIAEKQAEAVPEAVLADGQIEKSNAKQIDSTISDVFTNNTGKLLFALDNGQIWKQSSIDQIRGTVRPGYKVTIRKSGFGGYKIKVHGLTGFTNVERIK